MQKITINPTDWTQLATGNCLAQSRALPLGASLAIAVGSPPSDEDTFFIDDLKEITTFATGKAVYAKVVNSKDNATVIVEGLA